MAFDGFKTTKAESDLIARAFCRVEELGGHDYRLASFAKEESRGYGNSRDRVPLSAARGMCLTWFLRGIDDPGALLRDCYQIRPAAIYFQGFGADIGARGGITIGDTVLIASAVDAYDAAFKRMQARDKAQLAQLAKAI